MTEQVHRRDVLVPPHRHAVGFHRDDVELVQAVASYAAQGLVGAERVVTVVTPAHRDAVDEALYELGHDPVRARRDGSYVTLEAAHILNAFLVDGVPDRDAFFDGVGRLVSVAREDGSTVRIFGEMVSLLWDRGDVLGALRLESLWNELAAVHDFTLLCGYSASALEGAGLSDMGALCARHSTVVSPSAYASSGSETTARGHALEEWSEVLLPVPEAVASARRFVSSSLPAWSGPDVVWEAELLISELATNAVLHGRSPFRAGVSYAAGVVRIAVEDTAAAWPAQRVASAFDVDGRGLAIVTALADRTGCDVLPHGKIAWAELTS